MEVGGSGKQVAMNFGSTWRNK